MNKNEKLAIHNWNSSMLIKRKNIILINKYFNIWIKKINFNEEDEEIEINSTFTQNNKNNFNDLEEKLFLLNEETKKLKNDINLIKSKLNSKNSIFFQ